MSKLDIRCCDNMELMREFPDKYFDLAIVDPPYGIGASQNPIGHGMKKSFRRIKKKEWDIPPSQEYFEELFRVSKNQIIWGGNYFNLKISRGWIFWDKEFEEHLENQFSAGELAWTSFDIVLKKVSLGYKKWKNNNSSDRRNALPSTKIHPTQKPVALYKWLLNKYAKEGYKIIDTHLGSASIALACHDYGFDLTACELDKDHYEDAMKRINAHVAQQKLFI